VLATTISVDGLLDATGTTRLLSALEAMRQTGARMLVTTARSRHGGHDGAPRRTIGGSSASPATRADGEPSDPSRRRTMKRSPHRAARARTDVRSSS
jgi:hypothetical protein